MSAELDDAEFDDLEARMLNLLPSPEPVTSVEDFAQRLRELEDASEHEAEPEPDEEVPVDGQLMITYTRSVVRRDQQGRITEIVGTNTRKFIRRDTDGFVVAVDEVTETEEVEEPEA